ncbi:MAG: indole-3-glycerol-phosphate synthase [Gammaproteobacteria bacterium]|jgi:indole-3-glycerol phosphate synthase
MTSFLDRMAESSRERAQAARRSESLTTLASRAEAAPRPLPLRLSGFDLIAELKFRSPAAGGLADATFDAGRQLDAYVAGGAAAVSVLTEPLEFRGSLADLNNAAARLRPSACPVMRKDFLVDPYQVLEARANGASGVLLIVAMLTDTELDELRAAAREQELFVLLEAFDSTDLERLARIDLGPEQGRTLIGVNSRNLKSLAVDFDRFARLADQIRDDVPAVAESGIESAADIQTVAGLGYRLALVGSALMRDADVAGAVAGFVAAGRRAAAEMVQCS